MKFFDWHKRSFAPYLQADDMNLSRLPKPEWLRVKLPSGQKYGELKTLAQGLKLHTVCQEALCPNIEECWNGGTATFMLMGDTCTRGCRFCHVKTGNPKDVLDPEEPQKIAEAVLALQVTYVVLTSVDRDDLPDGGASHFSKTVQEIKKRNPKIMVECLVPDFNGDPKALDILCESGAEVLAQNIETVKRLTRKVRDYKSGYQKTLNVLEYFKKQKPSLFTKSSIMLGLGEEESEVLETMDDLRAVHVDILTLGQYLQPSKKQLPVVQYVQPSRFDLFADIARKKGFLSVAAGPLVRSSYRAGEFFVEQMLRKRGKA